MLYAHSVQGFKIQPTPRARAVCPDCGGVVLAKCGRLNAWHWAHATREDCDSWSEHESPWHLWWKSLWPAECVEVPMKLDGIHHRADIRTPGGIVIELQHSSLLPEEIAERERFYGRMVWVFDVRSVCAEDRLHFRDRGAYHTFRWLHPRKHISFARRETYLDVGRGELFLLKKIHPVAPCGGWGRFIEQVDFVRQHGGDATRCMADAI